MVGKRLEVIGVVVAGGRSVRFGGDRPKQFSRLAGRTVLERSVRGLAAHSGVDAVVVVVPADSLDAPEIEELRDIPGVIGIVAGGTTRAGSVRSGLAGAADGTFVLVHDAARPLVSADVIGRVVDATRRDGAAVPVIAVSDTLRTRRGDGTAGDTVDRDTLCAAQTPQGARRDWLVAALDAAAERGDEPTDEAAALTAAGRTVRLVDGEAGNVKITTPDDLAFARATLGAAAEDNVDLRIGNGFDVHRIDPTRPLVLGGVEFPGEPGLAGHSDADVVLHAAMDAALGAAGLDDIGAWFPPDDAEWKDADSRDLARRVAGMLAERGVRIVNLDVTVLAERPRIRDRVPAMRTSIAACFDLTADRVAVKATTLETLGALGRREGIACQASALVAVDPEGSSA